MSYLNYDEITTGTRALSGAYPGHCQLIELPNWSVEDRPVYALAIGDTLTASEKTAIFVGGMHAREWIPPDALLYVAADLLEARSLETGLRYGNAVFSKEEVRAIFSDLQIIILPCANPDGRIYSQRVDPNWRKNRSLNRLPDGTLCYGVDLNRNFDIAWDFKEVFAPNAVSASDDPCHKYIYVGPEAVSEPETRNVVWLLDTYTDTRWFLDIHSAVPALFHSWGLDENQVTKSEMNFLNSTYDGKRGVAGDSAYQEFIAAEDLVELNRLSNLMTDEIRKVRGVEYPISEAFSLYATSGASDDYAYSRHRVDPDKQKILSFTMECGSEFQPEWEEAEQVMREVAVALVRFCADARAGLGL